MKAILALFFILAITQPVLANENDWNVYELNGRPSAMTVKKYKFIQNIDKYDKEIASTLNLTFNGQGYLKSEIKSNSDGDTTVNKRYHHHKRGYSLGWKNQLETKYDYEAARASFNYTSRLMELQIVHLNANNDTVGVRYKSYNFNNDLTNSAYYGKDGKLFDKGEYSYDDKGRLFLAVHNTSDPDIRVLKYVYEFQNANEYYIITLEGSDTEIGRIYNKTDLNGNLISQKYKTDDREFESTYVYEYDDQKNWIKSTRTTNGIVKEVYEREITYY